MCFMLPVTRLSFVVVDFCIVLYCLPSCVSARSYSTVVQECVATPSCHTHFSDKKMTALTCFVMETGNFMWCVKGKLLKYVVFPITYRSPKLVGCHVLYCVLLCCYKLIRSV
jgi:hypothetical protein